LDPNAKIDSKTAAKILVEAAIEPQPRERKIL
jgi:hypothetical protein